MDVWSQVAKGSSEPPVEAPLMDELHEFRAFQSGAGLDADNTVEIRVSDQESYFDFSRASLEIKVRIADGNGAYAIDDVVLSENVWSMFRRAELYIHNTQVESVDAPRLVSHVRALSEFSSSKILKQSRSGFTSHFRTTTNSRAI